MKLSICITLYKSEKYFNKLLKWIENFSYYFEFILIDDASPNFTNSEFYKKVLARDIKVINKTVNLGVSNSRNLGIKIASSDYILFVDSDDDIDFQSLIESLPILSNDIIIFDFKRNFSLIKIQKDFNNYSEPLFNPIWNKIYSLSFLKNNNILFDELLFIAEDLEFNLKAFKKAIISFSNKVFYVYDDFVVNSLSKKFDSRAFYSYVYLFDYVNKRIENSNNIYKDLHLLISCNMLRIFSHNLQFKSKIIALFKNSVKFKYLFGSLKLINNRFYIKLYYFFIVSRLFVLIDIINYVKKTIQS